MRQAVSAVVTNPLLRSRESPDNLKMTTICQAPYALLGETFLAGHKYFASHSLETQRTGCTSTSSFVTYFGLKRPFRLFYYCEILFLMTMGLSGAYPLQLDLSRFQIETPVCYWVPTCKKKKFSLFSL